MSHKRVEDPGARPDMGIKVGCISCGIRILGKRAGVSSTEQSVGIAVGGGRDPNIIHIENK